MPKVNFSCAFPMMILQTQCSVKLTPNRADGVFERFICKLHRAKFPNKNHFDDGFEITSPNRT